MDPRLPQIAILAALLLYGATGLDLEIDPACAAAGIAGALLVQAGIDRRRGRPFDPRSALISGLSLALLLRTGSPLVAGLAGVLAVGSKALLRSGDKHFFNPTNFAIVVLLLTVDDAWVSPGQWGSAAIGGLAIAGFGALVVTRARRADVTLAFLGAHTAILFGRALWLGDPLAIPLHQLQSGALLIFAFLMISDPRSTPDARAGRVLFAVAVAGLAAYLRFGHWLPESLFYALASVSLATPLIDRLLPGRRYAWKEKQRDPEPRTPRQALQERPDPRTDPRMGALAGPRPAPGLGLLRLLRRQGRHEALEPRLAGRPGAR